MKTLNKPLDISLFSLTKTSDIIAHEASLFQISEKGFSLKVKRNHLDIPFKKNLSLKPLHNKEVIMHAPDLALDLDGVISHTRHMGKGVFEIFVKFLDSVPKYWNQCLLDILLSYPDGEFSKLDTCPNIQPNRF